jgi:hypothetical protein
MFLLNGNKLQLGRPFSHNGVNYPSNWLRFSSAADKARIGIIEEEDILEIPYDQRFYWGPNNPKLLNDREEVDEDGNPLYVKVLGEVNGEPAMIDSDERLVTKGLKSQWIGQVKETANKLLAPTDWYVIRKYENNTTIPSIVSTFRSAVKTECDRLETAITNSADIESFITVVTTQNWPAQG